MDYGTLDDLRGKGRAAMVATIERLSRPGSRLLLWCFQAAKRELPVISFSGPSRLTPGLAIGEQDRLFGARFEVTRLASPPPGSLAACYLMTRR